MAPLLSYIGIEMKASVILLFIFGCAFGNDVDGGVKPSYSCPEAGIDFYGNDVGLHLDVKSWADCGRICAATTGCNFWTWHISDGSNKANDCYLKSSDSGADEYSQSISGPRGCKKKKKKKKKKGHGFKKKKKKKKKKKS